MQLHPGWKIGLTGVNGAGKSTLFSALLGGMESDTGSLTRPAVWTVAHMAQEIKALNMKAIDFVLSGDEEYWDIQQNSISRINWMMQNWHIYMAVLMKFPVIQLLPKPHS